MAKQVVVIAGPSGSGKNAILRAIEARNGHCTRLVTATTRNPRPGERDGIDYYFLSKHAFDEELAAGNVLEHRYVAALDAHYGIYKPDLDQRIASGDVVFAVVDIVGAKVLKDSYDAVTIFVMPESLEQFERRLRGRNPEWQEMEFGERMRITKEELSEHAPWYDYRVVNADGKLRETVSAVIGILKKEGYNLS